MEEMKKWRPDKSLFKIMAGASPRWVTFKIFIDVPGREKDPAYAQYTYGDEHKYVNGKFYPSLKKLYLEEKDPTEYEFYTKWLGGKKHWEEICSNFSLNTMVKEWREELEAKMRSEAVRSVSKLADKGNFSAARFIATRGWETAPISHTGGRPTKREREREDRINSVIVQEGEKDDIFRLLQKGNIQ